MTQQEFDGLPGLLTAAQFMQVTGLNKVKLRQAVDSGTIKRLLLARATYGKYYKRDAARLTGFLLR